jgi:hypothetical protein
MISSSESADSVYQECWNSPVHTGLSLPVMAWKPRKRRGSVACREKALKGETLYHLGVSVSRIWLSLSRLNHRLPGREAHPEVVQGTADVHHQIADALLPQPDPVFDDATAFDTAVDMLDAQPALGERLIGHVLLPRQLLAAWFLGRHEDCHLGKREREEAQILQQPAPRGQGIRRRVSNALIMDPAATGVTQKEDREQGIDQQDIFDRMGSKHLQELLRRSRSATTRDCDCSGSYWATMTRAGRVPAQCG